MQPNPVIVQGIAANRLRGTNHPAGHARPATLYITSKNIKG